MPLYKFPNGYVMYKVDKVQILGKVFLYRPLRPLVTSAAGDMYRKLLSSFITPATSL